MNHKRIQSVLSELRVLFSLLLFLLTACGAQDANYTYGNYDGASSGTEAGSEDTGNGVVVGDTATFGDDPAAITFTQTDSYKSIIKMDTSFEGGTRGSRNYTIQAGNTGMDILFDL